RWRSSSRSACAATRTRRARELPRPGAGPRAGARLPGYAWGMTDCALFIRWGGAAAGRERQSVELFVESLKYLSGLVGQGTVKSVEPFFLEPHGGDLDGFFIVRGDQEELSKLRIDD